MQNVHWNKAIREYYQENKNVILLTNKTNPTSP